jgi:hypothetical protein
VGSDNFSVALLKSSGSSGYISVDNSSASGFCGFALHQNGVQRAEISVDSQQRLGIYNVAYSASAPRISCNTVGNVGINMLSAVYELDVTGDCNVTGRYLINGVAFPTTIGGFQTPWLQDINANNFNLLNITALGCVRCQVSTYFVAGPRGSAAGDDIFIDNIRITFENSLPLVARWTILKEGVETGADAGSDLNFYRYSDAGTGSVMLGLNRATGHVAVGVVPTIIPPDTLTVSGLATTVTNGQISWNDTAGHGGALYADALTVAIGTTSPQDLSFFTNNGVVNMVITTAGNVGINKADPGSRLAIVGLPTSAVGLTAGDVWNNGGVLNIV